MQTATKMFGVEDLGAGRMIFAMPDSSAAAIVNRHYQRVSGFNRGRRDLDETKRLRRRDCGLRNREVEAGNRFEAPKSLASKADCTERTGRCPAKSTSSVLFQSATTTPRQTSRRSILNDYSSVECEITPRNRFQSFLLPSARCSKGF